MAAAGRCDKCGAETAVRGMELGGGKIYLCFSCTADYAERHMAALPLKIQNNMLIQAQYIRALRGKGETDDANDASAD